MLQSSAVDANALSFLNQFCLNYGECAMPIPDVYLYRSTTPGEADFLMSSWQTCFGAEAKQGVQCDTQVVMTYNGQTYHKNTTPGLADAPTQTMPCTDGSPFYTAATATGSGMM